MDRAARVVLVKTEAPESSWIVVYHWKSVSVPIAANRRPPSLDKEEEDNRGESPSHTKNREYFVESVL